MARFQSLEEKTKQRNIRLAIGAVIVIAIAVVAVIVFVIPNESDEQLPPASYTLDEFERSNSASAAEELVQDSGDFGVISSSITGNNILNVSRIISDPNSDSSSYLVTRSDRFHTLEDQIAPGSPLDYSTTDVAQWGVPDELFDFSTFEVTEVNATAPDTGSYVTIDGTREKFADVEVTYTSRQTIRLATAQDSTWDGSYSVREGLHEESVTIRMVYLNGNWFGYSIVSDEPPFPLAIWANPNRGAYEDTQFDFVEVDIIYPDEPLPMPDIDEIPGKDEHGNDLPESDENDDSTDDEDEETPAPTPSE